MIPQCPNPLPASLTDPMEVVARAWATSPLRPRLDPGVSSAWERLIETWAAEPDLPLFVRRGGSRLRGHIIQHHTGRNLVPTDNSPAQWALRLALSRTVLTLPDVRNALDSDTIPVAMVLSGSEREGARYLCTLKPEMSLNRDGWKVGHLRDVGLGRGDLRSLSLDDLVEHFRRFLSPSNMFVVPLLWAGLAELPEMLKSLGASGAESAKG